MNDTCSYKEDNEFSKNPAFARYFNEYYTSDLFVEKCLKLMYRRNIPKVVKLIRSDEKLFQKGVYVDILIELSNGTTLPADEKVDRPTYIESPNIFLELISNPQRKTDGWAYHKGRFISYSCSNVDETGLCKEPVFFFIDENFINTFNRNKAYPIVHCGKVTDGLYRSLGKKIPREDIFAYNRGDLLPPPLIKPKKNLNLLDFGVSIK